MDLAALRVVKRSAPYRNIHGRLLSIQPTDQWQEDGYAFVLFDLGPEPSSTPSGDALGALALFVVPSGGAQLTSVKLVSPQGAGTAVVEDLLTGERQFLSSPTD